MEVYGTSPTLEFLKNWTLKMHFCIQVAAVDPDEAVLLHVSATSGVSDVDASSNYKN